MFIHDEAGIVELALNLDQNGDGNSRAMARALRGVLIPMTQHVESEMEKHWHDDDAMSESIGALTHIIGVSINSLAASIAFGKGAQRAERLKLLNVLLKGVQDIAFLEERKMTGLLEKEGRA